MNENATWIVASTARVRFRLKRASAKKGGLVKVVNLKHARPLDLVSVEAMDCATKPPGSVLAMIHGRVVLATSHVV